MHPFCTHFDLEVVFLVVTIYWVGEASHFEGISDGLQILSDSLKFDFMSHAVAACPDLRSKFCEAHVTNDGVTGLDARVKVNRI